MQPELEIIKKGGVAIFPTDTVCGIGCRIDDKQAVERVFAIKKRELTKTVPILCASIEMVKRYIEAVDESVEELMQKYWPGALTLICKAKIENLNPMLHNSKGGVGVRIPRYDPLLSLIEEVGVPFVGTSANFAGEEAVLDTTKLDPKLKALVDTIIPGKSLGHVSSTVLDVTVTPWQVSRIGGVKIKL